MDGGHPTEYPPMQGPMLGSTSERTDANPQLLMSPPPAPAGRQGVCCDVWSWFKSATTNRGKVKPGPQQKNLDDLGGTLEMCAPGIPLLAEGAHIRALTNCSCLRAQAHIYPLQLPHPPEGLSFHPLLKPGFLLPRSSDGTGVTRLVCPLCTWLILGRVSWGVSLPSTIEQLGRKLWSLKARWSVFLLA